MKKWLMWSLFGIVALLLLSAIIFLVWPAKLVIVPPTKVAVIVPVPAITPGIPQVVFIGVTTVSPMDLASNQGLINNIVVTFTEAMNPATLNENTFIVMGADNVKLAGAITSDATKKVWTFKPTAPLMSDSVYHVTITTGAKGVSGNAIFKLYIIVDKLAKK